MPFLSDQEIREAARRAQRNMGIVKASEAARFQQDARFKQYDIFLSQSSDDSEEALGAKTKLEDIGLSVYVDYIEDPELDRSAVSKENAAILQARMRNCRSLVYLHTLNSKISKWIPWELGYFDALNGKIAVLPVAKNGIQPSTKEQEYLELYDIIEWRELQYYGHRYMVKKRNENALSILNEWTRSQPRWDWYIRP